MRLIGVAEHYWYQIDGEAAWEGVSLEALPFRRFLNAILHWSRPRPTGKDDYETQVQQFDEWLYAPLNLTDPDRVSQDVIDDEMAAFMAFGQQAGGSA